MNELHKTIKKHFEECGFEIKDEENNKGIYKLESTTMTKDIITKIIYHKKFDTITVQAKALYSFKQRHLKQIWEMVNIINIHLLRIGNIFVNPETKEFCITAVLYPSNQVCDVDQFYKTLSRVFHHLQACLELIQEVDLNNKSASDVISEFNYWTSLALRSKIYSKSYLMNKYFIYTSEKLALNDATKIIIRDICQCVLDMQECLHERFPIFNDKHKLKRKQENMPTQYYHKIESTVFQINPVYIPEIDTVGVEFFGFPRVKDDYVSNYNYLFNWANQIQKQNKWGQNRGSNGFGISGNFILSDNKLDKYQFRKLINNTIENLEFLYPLMADQESIGNDVEGSIADFSKANTLKIARFHNE